MAFPRDTAVRYHGFIALANHRTVIWYQSTYHLTMPKSA